MVQPEDLDISDTHEHSETMQGNIVISRTRNAKSPGPASK